MVSGKKQSGGNVVRSDHIRARSAAFLRAYRRRQGQNLEDAALIEIDPDEPFEPE
jgi:hypothetical protein